LKRLEDEKKKISAPFVLHDEKTCPFCLKVVKLKAEKSDEQNELDECITKLSDLKMTLRKER
jgi:hypothetical protein